MIGMMIVRYRRAATACGLALSFTAMWGLTQWAGRELSYQPELGQPVARWGTARFYPPWEGAIWWLKYRVYAPRVFHVVAWGVPIACSPLLLLMPIWAWREDEDRQPVTYGSSRWADRRDIRSAGLFVRSGVILGRW